MPDDREMQPSENPERPSDDSGTTSGSNGEPVLADVLDQVISATRSDRQHSEEDAALRKRLLDVAQDYPGQSLCVEPILVSLDNPAAVEGAEVTVIDDDKRQADQP